MTAGIGGTAFAGGNTGTSHYGNEFHSNGGMFGETSHVQFSPGTEHCFGTEERQGIVEAYCP